MNNDIPKQSIAISSLLNATPGLAEAVSFVGTAVKLKQSILQALMTDYNPSYAPSELPDNVCAFLDQTADISNSFVLGCWHAFSDTIWSLDGDFLYSGSSRKRFEQYGLEKACSCISYSQITS